MPRLREFKFTGGEEPKTVEAMSYKKAVKSYQGNHAIKKYGNLVEVEWTTKKGNVYLKTQQLPMGRKDKIGR